MNETIWRSLRNKVEKDTLLKFYKTFRVPCCMYGSEKWTLRKSDSVQLQSSETRSLRSVAGDTKLNKVRNFYIHMLDPSYSLRIGRRLKPLRCSTTDRCQG